MEKLLFLFIHYGIPVLALLQWYYRRPGNRISLVSRLLFWCSLSLFVYLWGQYPMVGGYYLRYFSLAVFIILFFAGIRHLRKARRSLSVRWFTSVIAGLGIALSLPVWVMASLLIIGRSYPEPQVNLSFPLRNGTYYIASGGTNKVINNHNGVQPNSQQFAVDINKIGPWGRASEEILSKNNTSHYIFGQKVYAPCAGTVIRIKDQIKDNETASMDIGPEDGTGNFVELQCDDIYIFMPHLKEGTVQVKPGMQVDSTTILAEVGNSGYSQEPHLHFQASKKDKNGNNVGVPVRFGSVKLFRNDLIKN